MWLIVNRDNNNIIFYGTIFLLIVLFLYSYHPLISFAQGDPKDLNFDKSPIEAYRPEILDIEMYPPYPSVNSEVHVAAKVLDR